MGRSPAPTAPGPWYTPIVLNISVVRSPKLALAGLTIIAIVAALVIPLARVLVTGMLLLAPGYLMWEHAGRGVHLPHLVRPALWLGLSLSLIPLVFLWSTTLGLVLSAIVLRLMLAGVALLAAFTAWRHSPRLKVPAWLGYGLLFAGALTLALRLYEIRSVVLPLWVDSVHHALLIRVIGETGQYPQSLLPYVEIKHLAYHWGYHAVAATWMGISGLPLGTLMLLSGQVLNALHVLTVYALGTYLVRSPLAGLLSAAATGLLSMMPAYYVTWGRYTQLSGLLLLPAVIILSCILVEAPRRSIRLLACNAVALAGLTLVHYRVLVFYAAFMLAYMIFCALRYPRRLPNAVVRLAGVGALAFLLVLPWAAVLARQVLLPAAQKPASLLGTESYNEIDPALLWTTNSRELYATAGVGTLLALVTRRWHVLVVAGWVGILLLLANPNVIGLRPLWLINNHSVIITLFLPVSLLAGYAIAWLLIALDRRSPRTLRTPLRGLAVTAFVLLASFGAWQFRDIVNPVTDIATAADLPALQWAAENTPRDARFLINATPWLSQVYRGTDAGWWLTPLAGRWTSTPPAIYGYGSASYVTNVSRLSAAVAGLQPTAGPELDDLIRANHITHIFIGTKGGPLKGEMFWGRPQFKPVYDHDGVIIFEVVQP